MLFTQPISGHFDLGSPNKKEVNDAEGINNGKSFEKLQPSSVAAIVSGNYNCLFFSP